MQNRTCLDYARVGLCINKVRRNNEVVRQLWAITLKFIFMFDFDTIINRWGSDSVKYDGLKETFGCQDLLPMWVADMDFQSPPVVREAVRECCDRGVFGYTFRSEEGRRAFREWVKRRYRWETKDEWISSSPGIVTALALAVRAFTEPGDPVLIMTPVYPPFYSVVRENGRELLCSPLKQDVDKYVVDWENFERQLQKGVKLFILCNSHNPVGRVWTREELLRMGNLCCRYGVVIVSDEIHADLALFGNRHTVMASVSEEIAACTLTAMAPSKTFNIAGMMNSVIVASNPLLLEKYNRELLALHLDSGNIFGHVTLKAAYRYGEPWLEELIRYLEGNVEFALEYFHSRLPQIRVFKPEGSFLLWLDFRPTGLSHEACGQRLLCEGKIGLNDGLTFGEEGRGFRRMNIGCPRSVLEDGLERIERALKGSNIPTNL